MFALRIRNTNKGSLDQIVKPMLISTGIEISAINSPLDITLTGTHNGLKSILHIIKEQENNLVYKQLNVAGGFHSNKLQCFYNKFKAFTNEILKKDLKYSLISTVDGKMKSNVKELPELLARQLYSPVLFWKMIETSLEIGCEEFVELGKKAILTSFIETIVFLNNKDS